MTRRTRRRLTAAALCTAGLVVAGAPLAVATNGGDHHPGKRDNHPGKRENHPGKHHKPAYGQPGFNPGKPGSATLVASLLGRNEISMTTGRRRAGDLDGQGGATITVTKTNMVCFGIVVQGVSTPVAAHIHQGRPGVNGPILVGFVPPATFAPPATGDPAATSGCVAVDPGLAFDLRKHPNRYYVNVHTTEFKDGALRGQLHRVI
jgi:hypothetical protein